MEATVGTILKQKGHNVITVRPTDTVGEIAILLAQKGIGACPVLDDSGNLLGLVGERDIVRNLAISGAGALDLSARDIMNADRITCTVDDEIRYLMEIMTRSRIRHLPVMQDNHVVGIISIGDVVKQRFEEAEFELHTLKTFITS